MPLFLFCSGYVYKFVNLKEYPQFLLKKIRRLIIPYIVTSLIIISIKLLTERFMYVENPVSYESFIRILYQPEAGYFLWFVWSLWLMFIVFPFFSINRYRRLGLYIVVFVLSYIPIHWTEIFCINQTIHMARYFALGMLVADYKCYILPLKKIHEFVPFLLFFVAYLLRGNVLIHELLPYLGVWMVLAISFRISQKDNRINKIVMATSIASYVIYLFHTTFEGFVKGVLYKTPLFATSNELVFALIAMIIIVSGVMFPMVLYKYVIKKYRVARFLFGIN